MNLDLTQTQSTTNHHLCELATIAIVQLYRYRRVSSPLQRQQTKWVVLGIAASITVVVGGSVPFLIFPALAEPGSLYQETTPSCRMVPRSSLLHQCSTIFPLAMRKRCIPVVVTCLPVGAMPKNSPLWVK